MDSDAGSTKISADSVRSSSEVHDIKLTKYDRSSLDTRAPKTRRRSTSSSTSSSQTICEKQSSTTPSAFVHFGRHAHSGVELWETSYFLSILFEIFEECKDVSENEARLTAFVLCRLDEISFNTPMPIAVIVQMLEYFSNVRMKILLLLELLNHCDSLDCGQALMLLWQFSSYGYMTLFYVLDRIKFSIVNKDREWKSLLTIFEPLENKKHAAYIVLDKTNFYKPNHATIIFGKKELKRFF